jgi:hypothetical protein
VRSWSSPLIGHVRISVTSAIVSIPPLDLPGTVVFAGLRWLAKKEFHLTLLDRNAMEAVGRVGPPDALVRQAARGIEFTGHLTGGIWLLEEPPAKTLIGLADLDGARAFFGRLADSGARLEQPPFHVTLFTLGTSRGIGVHTMDELRSLGRELTAAEREDLLSRITAQGA